MHIASLHGPCPVPVGANGYPVGIGDWLASTNPSESTRAVDAYKGTIDAAVELGAKAIVVHLGNSGASSRQASLADTIARHGRLSDEHLRARDAAWQEREAVKGPHLEVALRNITALGEHARGSGVRLGVECRDGYHEIPGLDEFDAVLSACDGPARWLLARRRPRRKLDYLGFLEHEEFLRRYGDRLVGMHIHDTRTVRDHQAPGQGDTDFTMLARYLRPDTIRTLELHRTATAARDQPGARSARAAGGVRGQGRDSGRALRDHAAALPRPFVAPTGEVPGSRHNQCSSVLQVGSPRMTTSRAAQA